MLQLDLWQLGGSEPEDVALLRRVFRLQIAVLLSVIAHLVVVIALLVWPRHEHRVVAAELEQYEPPVPITFVQPKTPGARPSAPPQPQPRAQAPPVDPSSPIFRDDPPRPDERVDPAGRYKTNPDRKNAPPPPKDASVADKARSRGQNDTRPAGGLMGGDLPRPTPGVRPSSGGQAQAPADGLFDPPPNPPDLNGRLRDFRRAIQVPGPPQPTSPTGPRGGGSGEGGAELPALPFTGFGVGKDLEFESRDYDWGDYGRALYIEIWRRWHNRLLLTASVFEKWRVEHRVDLLDDNTRIKFTIAKSGKLLDIEVEDASGCHPLDDSAVEALKEAVLPPLPDDFPRGQETVHCRFIALVEIRGMRVHLEEMHRLGYF